MKKYLMLSWFLLSLLACKNDDSIPTPSPTPETKFEIRVHSDKLTAWSVIFDICPEDSERTYYYDIISKARWEQSDVATLQEEIDVAIRAMAEMTQTSYEETLAGILFKGDLLDYYNGAGYRPETEFYIYAFYWDANGPSSEVTLYPFTTPAAKDSHESLEIAFEQVTPYSMQVVCTPSVGITDFYYYFAETSKAEQMLASLEDSQAFLSYQAMNVGQHFYQPCDNLQQGLRPETSYTALVMAIDELGNRFMVRGDHATASEEQTSRVESALFEELLGQWRGTQTINDLYSGPYTSDFTVEIVQQVEGSDYDYRAHNQLVALVDGWCNIKYYGIKELEIEYAELEDAKNPIEVFGPKWVINIAEGDRLSMDGQARQSVIGWLFMGDCFLLNGEGDGSMIYTHCDLEVTLSEERDILTISSPAVLPTAYPSLAYQFTGYGWMAYICGGSEIVLTKE